MSRLIWIYTVCHSAFDLWQTSLFVTNGHIQIVRWKSPLQKRRDERVIWKLKQITQKLIFLNSHENLPYLYMEIQLGVFAILHGILLLWLPGLQFCRPSHFWKKKEMFLRAANSSLLEWPSDADSSVSEKSYFYRATTQARTHAHTHTHTYTHTNTHTHRHTHTHTHSIDSPKPFHHWVSEVDASILDFRLTWSLMQI